MERTSNDGLTDSQRLELARSYAKRLRMRDIPQEERDDINAWLETVRKQ